jgi:citrate lyase beta subunit
MTDLSTYQATSLSALLVTLEKALALKAVDERYEGTLRWLTAQTLTAFDMPPHYERAERCNDNHSEAHQAGIEALVKCEMKETVNV